MHLAAPPRKLSNPQLYYPISSRPPLYRRGRARPILWVTGIALFLLFVIYQWRPHSRPVQHLPKNAPPVVIVTLMDYDQSAPFRSMIKENRRRYAAHHGYATFFPNVVDYNLSSPPVSKSWAKIPAMRHAITTYPRTPFFWYVDHNAMIMNTSISLTRDILAPPRLSTLLLPEHPVIPSSGLALTPPLHPRGASTGVDFILTQDYSGLSPRSFVVRRSVWAAYFLDSWFDPLYREYAFQRAERHALEHLVQEHPTILAHLALVPQRAMNAYASGDADAGAAYEDGDFVASFTGCERDEARDCEQEARVLFEKFQADTGRTGSGD